MAQGGCPHGIGNGGPGYTIDCELDGDNQFHDKGVLSMAHAGATRGALSSSSCTAVRTRDRNHTCFGKVTEGLDIVDQIDQGDTFKRGSTTESHDSFLDATKKGSRLAALVCLSWRRSRPHWSFLCAVPVVVARRVNDDVVHHHHAQGVACFCVDGRDFLVLDVVLLGHLRG